MGCTARKVEGYSQVEKPGDFFLLPPDEHNRVSLHFQCPCGCGSLLGVIMHVGPTEQFAWDWDGNEEKPTVSPSIRHLDGCQWHGFLRNGVFESC